MWARLCKAIGREDLLARAEFKDGAGRAKHRAALNAELNAALAKKKGAEWIEALNAAGVPCGPIYSMDQVFADAQVKHIGAAVEVRHPRLGSYRVVNQAARLSRTPATMASASPELGEHTNEVLTELGYSAVQIAALRDRKAV
jgi:formyl-CoA transferase